MSVAGRRFIVATVLLGSGAEYLDASQKQCPSTAIIRLGAKLIDQWTRLNWRVDFEKIRKDIPPDIIASFPKKDGTPASDEDVARTIQNIIDILEFYFNGEPFYSVVYNLCEKARQKVLAISVEKAQAENAFERILAAAWLADLDSKRGKAALGLEIKSLPYAPFLRILIAQHFLTRVYWHHWSRDDRLILLEAAIDALEPLKIGISKPEIMRMIEMDAKNKES